MPLVVTFWIFSLLVGIGASIASGWGGLMLVLWLALACTVGLVARRASAATCPRCGASLRADVV